MLSWSCWHVVGAKHLTNWTFNGKTVTIKSPVGNFLARSILLALCGVKAGRLLKTAITGFVLL